MPKRHTKSISVLIDWASVLLKSLIKEKWTDHKTFNSLILKVEFYSRLTEWDGGMVFTASFSFLLWLSPQADQGKCGQQT